MKQDNIIVLRIDEIKGEEKEPGLIVFTHIFPPKYKESIFEMAPPHLSGKSPPIMSKAMQPSSSERFTQA